ncbi:MAG: flagellar basal body-associated FliL family protein [Parvibaculales bacterium]
MAEEGEGEKRGNLMIIIIAVVGGLVLVGLGLGVGYMLFGGSAPDPSAEVEEIIERDNPKPAEPEGDGEGEGGEGEGEEGVGPKKMPKIAPENETFLTTYYEFPGNLTTNLRGSRKFLQIGLGVSTQYDEQVMINVDTHQLALRSVLLATMSEFSEAEVEGGMGRSKLAERLMAALNAELERLEGFGGIEGVHFSSFVVQ